MISKTKLTAISGIFIIIAAIIGIFPWICQNWNLSWCSDGPDGLDVKITDPHNGQTVPNWITVRGTIEGTIPDDNYLWILAGLEPERQWWPQTGNIKPTGQNWEIRARIGGGPNLSIGLEYKLVAILVNEKTNEDFNNWLEEAKYPPMEFPAGMVLDKISVVKGEG